MGRRFKYVIYEVGYFSISLISRIINAAIFMGSMHQTLSSRTHIEARSSPKWQEREKLINRLFFWQVGHCEIAWGAEVSRARKTLIRNGDIK